MTALVWFTRDLRVHDHPALTAALEAHERVVPVFCLDDRLLHGRHASGPRTAFMLECLGDLRDSLRERGGELVIRRGPPERALAELARETGATEVYCSADSGPFARGRAARVREELAAAGAELRAKAGLHAVDDLGRLRTTAGRSVPRVLAVPPRLVAGAAARGAAGARRAAAAAGRRPQRPPALARRARSGERRRRAAAGRRERRAVAARALPRGARARVCRRE